MSFVENKQPDANEHDIGVGAVLDLLVHDSKHWQFILTVDCVRYVRVSVNLAKIAGIFFFSTTLCTTLGITSGKTGVGFCCLVATGDTHCSACKEPTHQSCSSKGTRCAVTTWQCPFNKVDCVSLEHPGRNVDGHGANRLHLVYHIIRELCPRPRLRKPLWVHRSDIWWKLELIGIK